MTMIESQIQRYFDMFLYDPEEQTLFYKSTNMNENHCRCVTEIEIIELLQCEHERNHRHASAITPLSPFFYSVNCHAMLEVALVSASPSHHSSVIELLIYNIYNFFVENAALYF